MDELWEATVGCGRAGRGGVSAVRSTTGVEILGGSSSTMIVSVTKIASFCFVVVGNFLSALTPRTAFLVTASYTSRGSLPALLIRGGGAVGRAGVGFLKAAGLSGCG